MHRLAAVALVLTLALTGCGDDEVEPPDRSIASDSSGGNVPRCQIGESANYVRQLAFPEGPTVFGCVRLASGQTVELSAHIDRIGHRQHVCINRRYSAVYVPSICPQADKLASLELQLHNVERPRAGRQTRKLDFNLVVSGAVSPQARAVSVRSGDRAIEMAEAAVVRVDHRLATKIGASGSFGYFVTELPPGAACDRIIVEARSQGVIARDTADPGKGLCQRAG